MPELPDVEGMRRRLARHVVGRKVVEVSVADAGVLRNRSARSFEEQLAGRRLGRPTRKGKWLRIPTDGPELLFHFGMTGELAWRAVGEPHPHDRVELVLDRGVLHFRDQRKLKGIWVAEGDEEAGKIMGPLGPDALGLSREELVEVLAGHRGSLKAALMDQSVLAGLGNLLTDEVLWHAGLNPGRTPSSLDSGELRRLHRAMQKVLQESVRAGRVPPLYSWLTGVRDTASSACPRCGEPLRRSRIAGRTSWWCPRCQTE
jgi:formamidopyrimidine-DNA glycosylase